MYEALFVDYFKAAVSHNTQQEAMLYKDSLLFYSKIIIKMCLTIISRNIGLV